MTEPAEQVRVLTQPPSVPHPGRVLVLALSRSPIVAAHAALGPISSKSLISLQVERAGKVLATVTVSATRLDGVLLATLATSSKVPDATLAPLAQALLGRLVMPGAVVVLETQGVRDPEAWGAVHLVSTADVSQSLAKASALAFLAPPALLQGVSAAILTEEGG